jgi:hypothetical protein
MSVHPDNRGATRRWKVRWRENGANRSRAFTLRRDAVAFDREIQRRAELGPLATAQLTERHGPSLGQWVERRWAPEHASTLAMSTRERYSGVYAVHIAPTLDNVPLSELTVGRLRQWQFELIAAGVNVGTIDKARTLLSSVLRHAAESEQLAANRCRWFVRQRPSSGTAWLRSHPLRWR